MRVYVFNKSPLIKLLIFKRTYEIELYVCSVEISFKPSDHLFIWSIVEFTVLYRYQYRNPRMTDCISHIFGCVSLYQIKLCGRYNQSFGDSDIDIYREL